jgi:hypothetical protein
LKKKEEKFPGLMRETSTKKKDDGKDLWAALPKKEEPKEAEQSGKAVEDQEVSKKKGKKPK